MSDDKLERLYKWSIIAVNEEGLNDSCFLESEKVLIEHGFRTRVLPNEKGTGYTLSVPTKDYEVANALYTGEVRSFIDSQKELYHVFESDLTFKNTGLYDDKFKRLFKLNSRRNYLYLGAIIVVLLLLFKFVKFL